MKEITLVELTEKVQELIQKHNLLSTTVVDLAEAVDLINAQLFAMGDQEKNLDNYDS